MGNYKVKNGQSRIYAGGILGNNDLTKGQKAGQSAAAVLSAVPDFIKSFSNGPDTKGEKNARTASVALQGATLGMTIGGPLGAGIGAGAGLIAGVLTGGKSIKRADELRRQNSEKVFSDLTTSLNEDYFMNQGYHSIDSAKSILQKFNGYV